MNWQSLFKNWKTSVGGTLAAIPQLVIASGFVLIPSEQHWLNLCQGVGLALLGWAAKDATTHSTPSEVTQAGAQTSK
jgi:hypothetical protein